MHLINEKDLQLDIYDFNEIKVMPVSLEPEWVIKIYGKIVPGNA